MTTGRAENNRKKKKQKENKTRTQNGIANGLDEKRRRGGVGGGKDLGTGSTTRSRAGVKQFMAVWEWGGEKGST